MKLFALLNLCLLFTFAACGVNKKSYYADGKKNFGQGALEDSGDATGEFPAPELPNEDDGKVSKDKDELIPEDAEEEESPPTDPYRLTLHNSFRAFYSYNSIRKLTDGGSPSVPSAIVRNQIMATMQEDPDDGLVLSAFYGDGESWSFGTQDIISRAGDENKESGEVSASGKQSYDRVTGDAAGQCPSAFVCITRMIFEPLRGNAATYCYQDVNTQQVLAIPFAPAPNYTEVDFDNQYGTFGPFYVTQYNGANIDCYSPPANYVRRTSVRSVISKISQARIDFLETLDGSRSIDFGIKIEFFKTSQNASRPYIDEVARLQTNNEYYFNEEDRITVKMIKTVREDVNRLVLQGAQVDIHFELCKNLMNETETNLCE